MKAVAIFLQKLRHPGNWTVIALLLGVVGLPAPVVALLGAILDLAPQVIDVALTVGAGAVAVALPDPGLPAP